MSEKPLALATALALANACHAVGQGAELLVPHLPYLPVDTLPDIARVVVANAIAAPYLDRTKRAVDAMLPLVSDRDLREMCYAILTAPTRHRKQLEWVAAAAAGAGPQQQQQPFAMGAWLKHFAPRIASFVAHHNMIHGTLLGAAIANGAGADVCEVLLRDAKASVHQPSGCVGNSMARVGGSRWTPLELAMLHMPEREGLHKVTQRPALVTLLLAHGAKPIRNAVLHEVISQRDCAEELMAYFANKDPLEPCKKPTSITTFTTTAAAGEESAVMKDEPLHALDAIMQARSHRNEPDIAQLQCFLLDKCSADPSRLLPLAEKYLTLGNVHTDVVLKLLNLPGLVIQDPASLAHCFQHNPTVMEVLLIDKKLVQPSDCCLSWKAIAESCRNVLFVCNTVGVKAHADAEKLELLYDLAESLRNEDDDDDEKQTQAAAAAEAERLQTIQKLLDIVHFDAAYDSKRRPPLLYLLCESQPQTALHCATIVAAIEHGVRPLCNVATRETPLMVRGPCGGDAAEDLLFEFEAHQQRVPRATYEKAMRRYWATKSLEELTQSCDVQFSTPGAVIVPGTQTLFGALSMFWSSIIDN